MSRESAGVPEHLPADASEEEQYVVGTVLWHELEITESDYERYEETAQREGMSLDEFVENLENFVPLVNSAKPANAKFYQITR